MNFKTKTTIKNWENFFIFNHQLELNLLEFLFIESSRIFKYFKTEFFIMTFKSSGYMTKSCIFSHSLYIQHQHRHADTRTGRLECWTNCFAACQCPKERAGRSEGAEAGQGKRKWWRTKREEDENERKNAGTKQAWSC